LYLKCYETAPLVQRGLAEYFPFYKEERRHQSLQYQTPGQVYRSGRKVARGAAEVGVKGKSPLNRSLQDNP
jgi:putative transposase